MTITCSCLLICSLVLNSAEPQRAPAHLYGFLPPMTTMPAAELKPLLDRWDGAVRSDKLSEKGKALSLFAQCVSDRKMRFHGSYVLRYDNPEIVDRVVELYLRECAKAERPPPTEGKSSTNPWYDGDGEYMVFLMTVAESTFDPRIYETVLNPPDCLGELRILYLATVNPETTLNCVLESKRGQRGSELGHPDYLYHGSMSLVSVDAAYSLLSLMCIQSPDTVREHRTSLLSFVKRHVKYYATPRKVDYRPEPVYLKTQDYDVRNGALDVLALLGSREEIPIIEDVIGDAPVMDQKELNGGPRDRREQLRTKGSRIIAKLRQ